MKKIVCDCFLRYTLGNEPYLINNINRTLVRSGHTDVCLVMKKKGQAADVSFVDNVFDLTRAQGIIIFLSGEPSVYNPLLMDYSISLTESSSPRHYQRRLGAVSEGFRRSSKRQEAKTRFCSFIYFNEKTTYRIRFVQKLQKYKKVDCPGKVLNNMGRIGPSREERIEFMSRSRFTIAFENSVYPGYLTEKIFDALEAGSVPIYHGDPHVTRFVNPKAFINVSDFPTMDAAIDYILKVDSDPELYESYQKAEPFLADSAIYDDTEENLALFYKAIFDQVGSVASRNSRFIRFYRRLYRALFHANWVVSMWVIPGGIPLVMGVPIYKLLLHWRVWSRGLPHVIYCWLGKTLIKELP